MQMVQNFPFFAIIFMTSCSVITTVLKPKAAKYYCLFWLCLTLENYFCLHCLRKEIEAKRQRKQERLNVDLGTSQGPDDL